MSKAELKEQLQEDVLTILEGFGVDEAIELKDYNNLVTTLCETIIVNVNKLK